jgi:hypothetical protein
MVMTASPPPLLDLATDRVRPIVKIDSVPYELRTSDDLALEAYRTIERLGPRIAVLLRQETLTPADSRELSTHLRTAVEIGLVAPPEVHAALGDIHRIQIAKVFFELCVPSLLRARASLEALTAVPRPGTKSSPGSNASTAARPRRGSGTRRSASSARTS